MNFARISQTTLLLSATVFTLSSAVAQAQSNQVVADGSSTVAPVTIGIAEAFQKANPDIKVSVATSGTGGGFKKFCAGETDISNASRPIRDSEIEACKKNGISYIELPIAYDGLAVVTNKQNDWAKCLTVDQLKKVWSAESEGTVTNWNQVDPKFPNQPLTLFGPGTDSGTFDYFKEAIVGTKGDIRADYTPSEDDNVIVTGVSGNRGALGYFGLAYYEENKEKLTDVAIDGGKGCVLASPETVQNGTYEPLSRPLFIYVKSTSMAKASVKKFIDFYLNDKGATARKVGYIALPAEIYGRAMARAKAITTGSVFKDAKPGQSITELFK